MPKLGRKRGDSLSYFDKNNETEAGFGDSSLKQTLVNKHEVDANTRKVTEHLPYESIFGFCKTFKKVSKQLGFHIASKTADLQDIIHTRLANDFRVTFNRLYLFVPMFIPDPETQVLFNYSNKNSFTASFNSWTCDRKITGTGLEYEVDVCSARKTTSSKLLFVALQTAARTGAPNKGNNSAIFDNPDVRKYFVGYDSMRYPKDSASINYDTNEHLDQNRDPKLFYKGNIGEFLLKVLETYPDTEIFYCVQIFDLRFQVDHRNPKNFI